MGKTLIYCFSGTGNCLDMAKNIARGLGGAEIVMLRHGFQRVNTEGYERVGFVFPCYGGGAPEDVLRYAAQIKIRPGTYTFAVSQSASYAGIGLYELSQLHPLSYWRTVTHQCSCIWLFPHTLMLPMLSPEEAQKRSEKLAAEIAQDILARKVTRKKPPKSGFNTVENKAWPVIAKKKAAAFAVSDKCVSCGQCERLCPRQNIRLVGGKPRFGEDCVQCLGCLQFCPQGAISIGKITDKREHYHNPNIQAGELSKESILIE